MEFVGLFVLQIFLLFILSSQLTKSLSLAIFRLTKSKTLAIYFLAIIFLPGVVVHELAHLLTANLLFVKTGAVEFFPVIKENEVKLGSVAIAKTDPLRRFLIGVAPIILGILFMAGALVYLQILSLNLLWQKIIFGYIIFVVGNTMYSSKKDMEGAIELILAVSFIIAVLYFSGLRLSIPSINANNISLIINVVKQLDIFLLIPLGIDVAVILLAKLASK